MPYALADEWFEEKLNSVSLSFQRQMMGKTRGSKSTGSVSQTRSSARRTELARERLESSKKSVKCSHATDKSELEDDDVTVAGVQSTLTSTPDPAQSSTGPLDISSLLYDMKRRVRQHHTPESIVKSMPTGNRAWTYANVSRHAGALNLKLKAIHWQAL